MERDDDLLSPSQRQLGDELRRLVAGPSPQVSARLMAAVRAAPRPAAPPRQPMSPWRRVAIVGAAAFALVGGGAGAMVASAHALPGSPTYPLRLAGERLRLTFASPSEKERLRISFARDRLNQATAATASGDRTVAKDLLRGSQAYLHDATQNLGDVERAQGGEVQGELRTVGDQQKAADAQLQQQGQQDNGSGTGPAGTGGSGTGPGA